MTNLTDGKHQMPINADNAAALAALRRAAVVARRRALTVSGYVLIGRDGKIVRVGPRRPVPAGEGDEPTPEPQQFVRRSFP